MRITTALLDTAHPTTEVTRDTLSSTPTGPSEPNTLISPIAIQCARPVVSNAVPTPKVVT